MGNHFWEWVINEKSGGGNNEVEWVKNEKSGGGNNGVEWVKNGKSGGGNNGVEWVIKKNSGGGNGVGEKKACTTLTSEILYLTWFLRYLNFHLRARLDPILK